MLSANEVAQILGVSPKTVQVWAQEGVMPCERNPIRGSTIRIRATQLLAFIEDPPRRIASGAAKKLIGCMRVCEVPRDGLFKYATEL